LPLPAMIDAVFKPGAPDNSAAIAEAVQLAAPSARVDDHASWFAPLAGIVDVLRWLAIAIGVLVTAATIAIVALSVRSAISTFGPTIETLHMMGAEDRTIAALFQYRYAIHGLTGGTIGFGAALVVVIMIGQLLAGFGGGIAGTISIPLAGWAALVALPLLVALLTRVTARLTVDRALKLHL
jgi:cell division transport system permease protein